MLFLGLDAHRPKELKSPDGRTFVVVGKVDISIAPEDAGRVKCHLCRAPVQSVFQAEEAEFDAAERKAMWIAAVPAIRAATTVEF